MKHMLAILLLLGSAVVLWAGAEVGQPAPDFTGTDINGQPRHLSDYKGKIVVLESYNQDCPFCHNHYETGAMQDLQKEMIAKGVIWLIVDSVGKNYSSYRPPELAKREWAKDKIQATAWLDDSSGQIGRLYGMRTTPHMFVIGPNGILAYQGAIDDRAQPEGDPRKAHNYVRDAVQKLQAGQKLEVTQTRPYGCGVKYGS